LQSTVSDVHLQMKGVLFYCTHVRLVQMKPVRDCSGRGSEAVKKSRHARWGRRPTEVPADASLPQRHPPLLLHGLHRPSTTYVPYEPSLACPEQCGQHCDGRCRATRLHPSWASWEEGFDDFRSRSERCWQCQGPWTPVTRKLPTAQLILFAPGTSACNSLTLFAFPFILPFCCTAYGRLLVVIRTTRDQLHPNILATNAASGFCLNTPNTKLHTFKAKRYTLDSK
jgi:hypothetical protein